jgi:hypothetical protein
MNRLIVAVVASTLALGFAACGTEVEEPGSAAKPNEKDAPSEIEEPGSAETRKETPAPSGVAEALREEQKAKPPSESELKQTEDLIPPEVIVDYMFKSNSFKHQFCQRYETLGYKLSLRSFASEIGHEPGFPPARVVFEEALSRC